ncbi:hypothetical protein [Terrabacter sp. BE26]|uniref:hypothetical protein n=1 Tax=Terrabacter sp. BE26 TaxID=2898152 RepID=UPI0035BE7C0B
MHNRSRWVVAAALVMLLVVAGCTHSACSFDACPDVPPTRAGRVSGMAPSGAVRWSTSIADLVSRSPTVSNGYVVLDGCHSTHLVQVATGAVTTPDDLAGVLGVVAGQVVGFPKDGQDDAMLVGEPIAGGSGGFSWSESPDDRDARARYRSSAVLTTTSVLGVLGRTLAVWTPRGGQWERTDVQLPVRSQAGERLLVLYADHVVVPGDDGSVLGVDLAGRRVLWRTLAPRLDAPTSQHVELDGSTVSVVTGFHSTDAPAVTGGEGIDYVGWRLDARTGRPVGSPSATVPQHPRGDEILATVRDPASGWIVTQRLEHTPRGGCF